MISLKALRREFSELNYFHWDTLETLRLTSVQIKLIVTIPQTCSS